MSSQPQIATESVTVVIDQQVLDEVRQGTDRALRLLRVYNREYVQQCFLDNQSAICIALGIALENHWGMGWKADYPVSTDPWSSERHFAVVIPPGRNFGSYITDILVAIPPAIKDAAYGSHWFKSEGLPEPISFQIELPLT